MKRYGVGSDIYVLSEEDKRDITDAALKIAQYPQELIKDLLNKIKEGLPENIFCLERILLQTALEYQDAF